jgi:hypothetical protein
MRLNANERFDPRIGRCCAGRWRRRGREEVKELHDSINPAGLIAAVNRLTVSSWIGVIGSAAYAARDFQADSDIDLIVLHPNESRFIWDTFRGRDLEIHVCAHQRLTNIAKHPEWFGVDWAWQIGKIAAAEHLDGVRPVLDPSPEARVIAMLAALGKVLGHRKKHREGRAPPPRVAHALTALRCLVDRDYPLRYQDDAEPIDVDYIDHAKPEIEEVLLSKFHDIVFFPEHRAGAEYVIERWALNLGLPQKGALPRDP